MRRTASLWPIGALFVSSIWLSLESGVARADFDHTGNYRWLLEFVCGDDPSRCLEREPPLSEIDIFDLGQELGRLVATSEYHDQIDETDLLEQDFLRLCTEDPARCWIWIQRLGRSGSIDSDFDGVLDGYDQCPGTPTPVSRARSILLSQQVAINEVHDNLIVARTSIIYGANGTLGPAERSALGASLEPLFLDLVSIANKQVEGRFVFGGAREDLPPFEISGTFDDETGPTVAYRGSSEPLRVNAGRSGEPVVVAIPGSSLFLGDFNVDGSYPDADGADLFDFLKETRHALRSNDLDLIRLGLRRFDEIVAYQIGPALHVNGDTFAAIQRLFPRTERSGVDASGCSQPQFCAAVRLESWADARACFASDYLNDEPLRRIPRDCRVHWRRNGDHRCVSRPSSKRK
ncbi:MAG: hypothetical protein CL908_01760 [Deltaproteobacteria bacterium]|nr:hypothetical protein [Deltaproteobacteria bacterium]